MTRRSGFDRGSYGPVIVALLLWQDRASPGNPDGGIMAFHGGGGFARGGALSGGCFRMATPTRCASPGTCAAARR